MFDWLFGSKPQVSYDDLLANANAINRFNTDMSTYYDENIGGGKWDTLSDIDKAITANIYNQMVNMSSGTGEQYQGLTDLYNQEQKANRYNYFGNGMLGALLNPIGQTLSAGKDLATGQYMNNDRDAISDLGALGESALTFVPGLGLLGKGGKIGLNSAKGMGLLGAEFGAMNALREGGSDVDFGDVLSQAGTGALFGGGLGFAGNKAGKFLKGRGANEFMGGYLNKNPEMMPFASSLRDKVASGAVDLGQKGLVGQGLKSLMPKSTVGKVALGGAGLYGGMKLLGGGQQEQMYDPYGEIGGYY